MSVLHVNGMKELRGGTDIIESTREVDMLCRIGDCTFISPPLSARLAGQVSLMLVRLSALIIRCTSSGPGFTHACEAVCTDPLAYFLYVFLPLTALYPVPVTCVHGFIACPCHSFIHCGFLHT